MYILLDTSGTYTTELKKAQQIIHYYLGTLGPGDSFAVARIDSGSFSEKDIICLLYTSDAADDSLRVDLGGRRIIKKPTRHR